MRIGRLRTTRHLVWNRKKGVNVFGYSSPEHSTALNPTLVSQRARRRVVLQRIPLAEWLSGSADVCNGQLRKTCNGQFRFGRRKSPQNGTPRHTGVDAHRSQLCHCLVGGGSVAKAVGMYVSPCLPQALIVSRVRQKADAPSRAARRWP